MARIYQTPGPSSNKMAAPVKEVKADTPEAIRKLKTEELEKRAAELGLDISGCKNNPERADAIIAELEKRAGNNGNE